jgi:hypothetical protein
VLLLVCCCLRRRKRRRGAYKDPEIVKAGTVRAAKALS